MKKRNTIIYYLTQHRFILFTCSLVVLVGILGYGYWKRTIPLSTLQSNQNVKPLCKDCNIILMTLDVCSAKSMPCYGYDRNTTPNLCAFAQKNQLFLNSYANATWTLPSHMSLLTGLVPSKHGVIRQGEGVLSPSIPFLPEVLQKNGYETVLFQQQSSTLSLANYSRGVSENVDTYDIDNIFYRIDEANKRHKKIFVSYYNNDNCHEPYLIGSEKKIYTTDSYPDIPSQLHWEVFSPGFYTYLMRKLPESIDKSLYGVETDSVKKLYQEMLKAKTHEEANAIFTKNSKTLDTNIVSNLHWSYIYETFINVKDKRQMIYLRALYDQILKKVDATAMIDFIDRLKVSPYKDNTIVIITSEHGQEFGEHGVFSHTTLYEGNMRVPFLLSVPGIPPHTIQEPVQGVDIMPTLLDLVGISHSYIFDGESVVPLLQNKKISERIIMAEGEFGFVKSLRKGDWNLLIRWNGNEFIPYELFHTKTDPAEAVNLLYTKMDLAKQMMEEYKLQYYYK